jgi:predicted transcriptional regulator of viral defense system
MSLEEKFNRIQKEIGKNTLFNIEDVKRIFPEKKDSTIYWDLSKMVEDGYFIRIRNGLFKIGDAKTDTPIVISYESKKIITLLEETGFAFYISGIDIVSRYLHHIPESYPFMVFVDKMAASEIIELLVKNKYNVVQSFAQKNSINELSFREEKVVLLKETESFENVKDHFATIEKAFLDLFFDITRENFPLSLQELARVYQNLVRNAAIDLKHLVKIAYARNMQYDIRFIVESRYISNDAKKFVEMIREGTL